MEHRSVFVEAKSLKRKRVYYLYVLNYRDHPIPTPPPFRKTFQTRKEAVEYAYATIKKLNGKLKSIRYMTRFLND